MKTHRSTPPVTTRPIPGFVAADDIALSPDFNAHAFIVKSDKDESCGKRHWSFNSRRDGACFPPTTALLTFWSQPTTQRTQCFGTLPAGP